MGRRLIKASILLLVLACRPALSQVAFEGCVDFRGLPVASIADGRVPDIAMATYAPNGAPIIVYNPGVLAWVSPPTRVFFYAHECGHHVLGHGVQGHPLVREQEADCWAVQQLVGSGQFGNPEINAVQWDISRFGRGDWSHLPGPIRAINLGACLGAGGFGQ